MRTPIWIGRWLVAIALAGAAFGAPAQPPPTYTLSVDGLACPFCAYGIEKHLRRIDAVRKVQVDVSSGQVQLWTAADASVSEQQVRGAITDAGFELNQLRRADPKSAGNGSG